MTAPVKDIAPRQGSIQPQRSQTEPGEEMASPACEKLFTADFVFAIIANFFNSFGAQMATTILPLYVISLGGRPSDAGLVGGFAAFTALLLRPLVGWLTDAWRRRPMVLIGNAFTGIASLIYLSVTSVPFLLVGRASHGVGISCYSTGANAYLADIAPPRRRAEAMGLFAAMADVGMITGPAIGFVIADHVGFRNLFIFSAALAAVTFTVSLLSKETRAPSSRKTQPWSPRTSIVAVDALPIAWTALCFGAGFGPLNAYIALYAQSRGIENPGLYFTVQAVALLLSRTFAGRLADRRGRAYAIVPGVLLMFGALILLPIATDFPHFSLSAALFGFGFGSAQPATMALLADKVRPERRGLAVSTYFTGFDIGISMGAISLGMVVEAYGFGTMWAISAFCTLMGLLGLLAGRGNSSEEAR